MLARVEALPIDICAALAEVGAALRDSGYRPRAVAQALGIIAWNGRDLDGTWWENPNLSEGRLGALVELLVRGERLRDDGVRSLLPDTAWRAGIVSSEDGWTHANGVVLPLAEDLVWTDRGDRAFVGDDGLFLPDSTSYALRRCIPPDSVERHLDIGAGGGCVTIAAARRATRTVALDLNPRSGPAVLRSAALSGVDGVEAWTGAAAEAVALGTFDRVSFVLPLLVPWGDLPEAGPVHTIAAGHDLLAEVISLLPALLAPGGLALLYTQDWLGDQAPDEALDHAFGARPWRGAFWWDTLGGWQGEAVRSGVLAVRADDGPGWFDRRNRAPDAGVDDWWPHLGPLLTED